MIRFRVISNLVQSFRSYFAGLESGVDEARRRVKSGSGDGNPAASAAPEPPSEADRTLRAAMGLDDLPDDSEADERLREATANVDQVLKRILR